MGSSIDLNIGVSDVTDNNHAKDEQPTAAMAATAAVLETEPRLPQEMNKWTGEWCEATAASDLTNHVLSPVLYFLVKPGLPPYYKFKALFFCSSAYKDGESPRDLESRRYFLEKAQVAAQRCDVYTHPEDCKEVQKVKDRFHEEWQMLLGAEAAAKEDCHDGQAEHQVEDSHIKLSANLEKEEERE